MIAKFYKLIAVFCMMLTTVGLSSQNGLTCNDHINVGINLQCEIDLTIDAFIEGDDFVDNPAYPQYFYVIYDLQGSVMIIGDINGPSVVNGIILNQILDFSIFYGGFALCSGTLIMEDKVAPVVSCDCPVGGEDLDGDGFIDGYADECTLSCYELPIIKAKYWHRLRDELIPEDVQDFLDDNIADNCGGIGVNDISYYDIYIDLGCSDGTLLRRTWNVEYPFGSGIKTASCTREYYFEPVGLETADTARIENNVVVPILDSIVLPFHIVEVSCGSDISPQTIAAAFDNPLSRDQDTDDNNYTPQEGDIDLVEENNEGIPYAYPHYYVNGRNPSGPHPQAIDNEVCNILIGYSDTEIEACKPGCNGNRKVLRTWTLLDWCSGEYITYGQVIKAIDTSGPSIDVGDITVSVDPWDCETNARLPDPEHLNDDCDLNFIYWIGYVEGGLEVTGNPVEGYVLHNAQQGEVYQVEYIAEDCCGNRGSRFYNVHVVDLTPPVAVTKEFIVVSLTNIGNPIDIQQGIAKVYATDIDNGSHDGCSDVELAVKRLEPHCESVTTSDTSYGEFVKFCCEDLNGKEFVEIDVLLRVTDENGNHNYAWSTIRVEDKSNNTQVCPKDIVLTCEMDFNDFSVTGLPQGFAACGELNLDCDLAAIIDDTQPRRKGPNDGVFNDPKYDGVEVAPYDPGCGFGALRRQFKNCSSCIQWIIVEPTDEFDPFSLTFPRDVVVDCDGFDTGEPEWEISACNLIGVSVESDTFHFESGSCMKIINRWSVINWCTYDASDPTAGGKYDHLQVIIINDSQDPVLTVQDSICLEVNDECISKGHTLTGSATDEGECGSDWLKWEVTIDLNADWSPDYTYASNLPEFINGNANPYYIPATTNNEKQEIVLPEGIQGSKIWHRAVWRVYDGCGNNTSTVKYFQIADKKAPTPYCLNLSTAVMSQTGQVELWAIDFDAGSFDNCSPDESLIFTFTDVAPPPRDDTEYSSNSDLQWYNGSFWYYDSETGDYQDQDDYFDQDADRWDPSLRSAGRIFTVDDINSGEFVQIPVYAWDECGNKDFCIVNIRLIDNMGVGEGRVSGHIATEANEMIEDVEARIMTDDPSYPQMSMTNQFGEYAFDNTPLFRDYQISAYKDGDYLNGVSTLDLVFIQKHILGQKQLDSPYKLIAADVNSDRMITAMDLIDLRKLILGLHTEFPNSNSWKFVDEFQQLSTDNVWDYREQITITDIQENALSENFIGVKMGDVNNSVELGLTEEDRVDQLFGIRQKAENTPGVDLVTVDIVSLKDELYGAQFTLDINGYTVEQVSGKYIDSENFALHEEAITFSFNSETALSNDEILASITLRPTQSASLDNVQISSSITHAEAYVGSQLTPLQIDYTVLQDNRGFSFGLRQNRPNPFNEETSISFTLSDNEAYQLSFFDLTGRLVFAIQGQGVKGINEIHVSADDLQHIKGVIYYELKSDKQVDGKYMIVL